MKKYMLALFLLVFSLPLFANKITTIEDGVLKIAVTGVSKNSYAYKILTSFAEKYNLSLEFIIVNFDKSWQLAGANVVDVVATGISFLPERDLGRASYSEIYTIVKRGIRIKLENKVRFKVMNDFIGETLGAVKGMTSEKDLRNRAVQGIRIATPDTWDELYNLFNEDKIAGISEGFHYFPDEPDFNEDEKTTFVDVHDLEPGKIEGNRFVVRKASTNLLGNLNQHLKDLGYPSRRP